MPHQPDGGSQEIELLLLEEERSKVKGKNKWCRTHLARPADVTSGFTTFRGTECSGSWCSYHPITWVPPTNTWLSRPTLLTLPCFLNSLLIHLAFCEYNIYNPSSMPLLMMLPLWNAIAQLLAYINPAHFSRPSLNSMLSMNDFREYDLFPLLTPASLVISLKQFSI